MASNEILPASLNNNTTTAQLNYQYDVIDDTANLYNANDYSYNNNDEPQSNAILDSSGGLREPQQSPSLSLVSDDGGGGGGADDRPPDNNLSQQKDYGQIMENRNNESNEFRVMIVCFGLALISVGILANLVFSLLVMCRRRKRQTSSTIIMASMCLAYFVFLLFYCFKISVYFNGDNIIKFDIYDSIQNWVFGNLMCKLISGLPICCKLISRLSLFSLALKRLFSQLLTCEACQGNTSSGSETSGSEIIHDTDVNIIKRSTKNRTRTTTTRDTHQKSSILRRKLFSIKKLFEWPLLCIVIGLVWLTSILGTLPIFTSFAFPTSVDDAICGSEYRFPEDIKIVQGIWFNYLIYGLVVPLGLVFVFLIVLYFLRVDYCASFLDSGAGANPNGSTLSSSTFSSSQQSTPNKKLQLKSSSTASFDEINSSNLTQQTKEQTTCTRRGRSNNLMLWVMFIVSLATSLPPELYRYMQLKIDFNNDEVLSSYLESKFIQPVVRARPYYAMQLIYISEFAITPLLFILFYLCTSRQHRASSSLQSSSSSSGGGSHSNIIRLSHRQNRMSVQSKRSLLFSIFYDPDLVKTSSSTSTNRHRSTPNVVDQTAKNLLFSGAEVETNNYPLLANNKQYSSEPKLIYTKKLNPSLKPTPFELASNVEPHNYYQGSSNSSSTSSTTTNTNTPPSNNNNNNNNLGNVLHIIQHPSWRINIKQQPNSQNSQQHYLNNSNNNSPQDESNVQHLPFNYVKTNMYKN